MLDAFTAALVLLFPGAAMALASSDCTTMAAEVDRLSVQLTQASEQSQAQLDDALAEQARYARAAKRQRSAGAVTDVLASAIGGVVPGVEQLSPFARATSIEVSPAIPAPDRTSLNEATAAMIAQGEAAARIGQLIENLTAAGCSSARK